MPPKLLSSSSSYVVYIYLAFSRLSADHCKLRWTDMNGAKLHLAVYSYHQV